jgi:hypothetical protein
MQRDRMILKFIETYGGITINQCAKMFFNDAKHSYDLARKRLKKISQMTEMKYVTNKLTGERVYCESKKLTPHSVYLLDFYATLIGSNCKILEFAKEHQWMNGKYRSDALFIVEYNETKRMICVEIDVTHTTDISKYDDIFQSGDVKLKYDTDAFPLIVIVGDTINEYYSDLYDVTYLDYKLNGFIEKVLA